MNLRPTILAFLLLLTPFRALSVSAEREYNFMHFGAKEGMGQIAIWGLAQDGEDNIWHIGGNEVFCYNGQEVKHFLPAGTGPGTLPAPPNDLTADSEGRIWLLCGRYFGWYDMQAQQFRFSPHTTPAGCRFIREKAPGYIFICSDTVCFEFDEHRDSLRTIPLPGNVPSRIRSIQKDGNAFFVGTYEGEVLRWEPDSGKAEFLAKADGPVQSLYKGEAGILWYGTKGDGLYSLDLATGARRHFTRSSKPSALISDQVRCICQASDGNLWIGTLLGLDLLQPETGTIRHLTREETHEHSLSHNTVRCILRDRSDGMWIGTYYGGINYWHPRRDRFRHITTRPEGSALNDHVVSHIVESSDGKIWIGTNRGGVNCLDPDTGRFTYYKITTGDSDRDSEFNDIKAICPAADGRKVYIGAYGSGLHVLDRRSGQIHTIDGNLDVYAIAADEDGQTLWIGAVPGLLRLDTHTGSLNMVRKISVRTLMMEPGRLWAGTYRGIRLYETGADGNLKDITPDALSGLQGIVDIFRHPSGSYYLSSPYGLFRYDPDSGHVEPMRTADGRPFEDVNGTESDEWGNLWISTKHGLFRSCLENGEVTFYDEHNSLLNNTLLEYAHCRLRSGAMLFGGMEGINVFNPGDFLQEKPCPDPHISAMYVGGIEILPGDRTGILTKAIGHTETLRLRHNQNDLTFHFSAPDYEGGSSVRFECLLSGFDKGPTVTDGINGISYRKLPKGHYRLEVSARNNSGSRSPGTAVLSVTILPVWYKTRFAFAVEGILLIILLVTLFRQIMRQKDLAHRRKLLEAEERYRKDLQKLKVFKFINSGKEIGTDPEKIVTDLSPADEQFLLQAIETVEQHLKETGFNVDRLAHLMGISRTTLLQRIKAISGKSALDFIHKIRYSAACRLLEEGKLSIKEICYETGFSSPSYFTAGFRHYTGVTPLKYRERSLNKRP